MSKEQNEARSASSHVAPDTSHLTPDTSPMTPNPPPITQQVTFLYTHDLAATHEFYTQVLGLPLVLDQGACRVYQVQPTAFLGFCQAGTAVDRTVEDPSGVILTLVSDHVDNWHDYLQTHHPHVAIEKPPTLNETYNIYHLFMRDPNHYLVEIQTFLDPAWPSPHF